MRILVAIDDSPHSRAALQKVRDMCWPEGTTVHVLSVVRPAAVLAYADFQTPGAMVTDAMWEEQVQASEALLAAAAAELRRAGLTVTSAVLNGDPREAIVDDARREHADLVVVGSHGRTGLARLLMGSVAAFVVAHAPCDVLVVRLPGHPA